MTAAATLLLKNDKKGSSPRLAGTSGVNKRGPSGLKWTPPRTPPSKQRKEEHHMQRKGHVVFAQICKTN
eukprot:749614-Prorocentrum_minimum.AAC.1